jgi:hypothetical protein
VSDKFEQTATQSSLDSLTNTVDHFIKRLDEQEANELARDAQFERLLEWARKVSAKTGIPLENL